MANNVVVTKEEWLDFKISLRDSIYDGTIPSSSLCSVSRQVHYQDKETHQIIYSIAKMDVLKGIPIRDGYKAIGVWN